MSLKGQVPLHMKLALLQAAWDWQLHIFIGRLLC